MNREAVREHLRWRGFGIDKDDTLLTFVELNDIVRRGIEKPIFKTDIPEMQAVLIKQGIRIADDDPIFSLLAINDAVLRDALQTIRTKQGKTVAQARRRSFAITVLPMAVALGIGMLITAGYQEPSNFLVGLIGALLGAGLCFIFTNLTGSKETHKS